MTATAIDTRERIRRRPVRTIAILAGISAFGPLTTDVYLPGLPQVGHTFATTASNVQLTLTACLAGLALGQLVAGPLSDRFGRRRPLLVGLALFVVASVACTVAPTIYALDAARLAQGLAGAAGIVIARAIVRDLHTGKAAGRYFSALAAVGGVAPIVAPLLGGQLLRIIPWQGIFLVLAAIGVVLFVAVAVAIPETRAATQKAAFVVLLKDRRFVGYVLGGGLAFAAMFSYISASSFVYEGQFGVSPQVYSLLFGLNSLGLTIASVLNGRLLSRFSMTRLLAVGLAMTAGGGIALLVCVVAGAGIAGIVPTLFVAVSGIGMIFPNSVALAMSAHGERAGSASAVIGVVQFTCGAAIAPVVGIAGVSAVPMAVAMATLGIAAIVAVRLGEFAAKRG
ncbi:multidrug effflux MFS transporter [Fodinicola acaciae]|uniref:multidrug effflux MFS transporter n=1 Tax=Fodinicola acaciae TaxID=2681555 RepID=UPI0013D045F6|nr:multidrug effflux MFS transporter [Fodinicola acaciae]